MYEPLTLIFYTLAIVVGYKILIAIIVHTLQFMREFKKNVVIAVFKMIMHIPFVKNILNEKQNKMREEFRHSIKGMRKNQVYKLPQTPMKPETILQRMRQGADASKTFYTNGGKVSGAVYTANDDHWDFITEVMRLNIESNPLHFAEFSHVGQMEAEIIKMYLDLYYAP